MAEERSLEQQKPHLLASALAHSHAAMLGCGKRSSTDQQPQHSYCCFVCQLIKTVRLCDGKLPWDFLQLLKCRKMIKDDERTFMGLRGSFHVRAPENAC